MTVNDLIAALENIRDERGNVDILVDHMDRYGEYDGLTEDIHIDWDDDYRGFRIGCQDCE